MSTADKVWNLMEFKEISMEMSSGPKGTGTNCGCGNSLINCPTVAGCTTRWQCLTP